MALKTPLFDIPDNFFQFFLSGQSKNRLVAGQNGGGGVWPRTHRGQMGGGGAEVKF